jgi:ribosomal protein S18 acetylase RimI-like enzyme
MTIQISELADKHLPTVVRLLNEEYKDSDEFIPFHKERIASEIKKRDMRVLVATENRNVIGVIASHTHVEQLEEHISWLAAQEGHHQKIIENMLVSEIEKNAKGNIIETMIDQGNQKINDWINRGYILHPGYQRMSAKLDTLKPIPKFAEGIEIRSLKPGEEEKLITVINAGFGWQRLEQGTIETWKLEDPPFNEEWVQVAEIDRRFVSAVVAKPDTDSIKYLNLKRGYLGPAATLPEYRNQHFASALTARAMNFLREKGMESVRLGTAEQNVSSNALLRSLGFQVEVVRKILRKELKRL